jgi:hypothetical protein
LLFGGLSFKVPFKSGIGQTGEGVMKLSRRLLSTVLAGAMTTAMAVGFSAVALSAPVAQAATTCVDPGPATNFTTAGGDIDIAAYLAAVGAFNACVSGGSAGGGGTATPVARTLAFTGSDSKQLGALGIALAGVGVGAVVLSRRRRHAHATTGSDVTS